MKGLERYVDQVLDDKYRRNVCSARGGVGAVYLATHVMTQIEEVEGARSGLATAHAHAPDGQHAIQQNLAGSAFHFTLIAERSKHYRAPPDTAGDSDSTRVQTHT